VGQHLFVSLIQLGAFSCQSIAVSLGVSLMPLGLANEKYDVSYPSEAYLRYQAYEPVTLTSRTAAGLRSERRLPFSMIHLRLAGLTLSSRQWGLNLRSNLRFTCECSINRDCWVIVDRDQKRKARRFDQDRAFPN
jgi:hypothetical protein